MDFKSWSSTKHTEYVVTHLSTHVLRNGRCFLRELMENELLYAIYVKKATLLTLASGGSGMMKNPTSFFLSWPYRSTLPIALRFCVAYGPSFA